MPSWWTPRLGAHLWAERFDRETSDPFAVQNEITSRIALTLQLELAGAEASRAIERPDAMDYILRGRAASYKSPARENYAEAVGWFERAMSLDPASVEAKSLLASILAARALDRMTDTPKEDFARAEALVREVLAVSPRSPIAHYGYGQVLRATRRNEQCIPEYQEALAFNHSWVDALAGLSWCKFWVGLLDEAIDSARASDPPQSPRSADRLLVPSDRPSVFAAIAHSRSDPFAGEGSERDPYLRVGLLIPGASMR